MPKFQLYIGKDRLYRWRLIASNGENICWGEGYSSKQNALNSIAFVKKHSGQAPIVDSTKI